MSQTRPDLEPLLTPNSIAIVGASPESHYSSGLIQTVEFGYEGTIYPVNPSREEVWGRSCYNKITDVPEVVDLVIVSVPREYVVDVVRDAGQMGVPAALVITAGFSEADQEGIGLESELIDVAEQYDVRVCGPNCIGLSNMHDRAVLKAGSEFREPEPGSIGLVSQSGALAFTTFYERGSDEDIRFAYIVSTGNEAVLSTTDYVEYMAGNPEVDVICAYIEGIDDPQEFMRVADTATRNGTPVLTVKIGQSEFAEAATMSHTGSLVGNDDAWDAAFEQTGVERVPDFPDLLSRASAHAEYDPPSSNRVCVASTSGGLTSLLADMAAEHDLELPDISGKTERNLLDMEELLTFGEMNNPADIRGYGAAILPQIADVLFADDNFDAYVFALGLPAVGERADNLAEDILTIAERATDPVFFLWTGRKEPMEPNQSLAYERVREEIPLFYDPSRCMDALGSLVHFNEWCEQHADRPSRSELLTKIDDQPQNGVGSELPTGRVLTWTEAEELLEAYGIPVLDTRLATDADEAATIAADLSNPLVLKVDSSDIPHRTDAGAVLTGINSEAEARDAYTRIMDNARAYAPDADINGILLQPQVTTGIEALVGVSDDKLFGPMVTVGSGGTLVEVLNDQAIRIPPFSDSDAIDAIKETRLSELLAGHRGGPEITPEALADLMCRVGTLACEVDEIAELDLNPVLVHEDGISVADILIRTE